MTWRRLLAALVVSTVLVAGALVAGGCLARDTALFPLEVDGQLGFMDRTGEMVIEPQFYSAFPFSEGLALVTSEQHGGLAYIDPTGKVVLPNVALRERGDKTLDANAKALVRNAMTAIESAYVDLRTFDPSTMTPDYLIQIEPSIRFNVVESDVAATSPTAKAGWDEVDYWGDQYSYAAGSLSESGTTFGVVVHRGSSRTGNTFCIDGEVADW